MCKRFELRKVRLLEATEDCPYLEEFVGRTIYAVKDNKEDYCSKEQRQTYGFVVDIMGKECLKNLIAEANLHDAVDYVCPADGSIVWEFDSEVKVVDLTVEVQQDEI